MDVSMISDLPDMIQLAIMACDRPPKAIATDIECSVSAIYEAVRGTRQIPAKVMRDFSQTNLLAAASMALQATGLKCFFGYRKGDRHIQSRLVELKMYDKQADEAMHSLPEMLFNKNTRAELSEEDLNDLILAITKMVERDNVSFNLMMELDVKYQLNLADLMQKKETALAATSTASSSKNIIKHHHYSIQEI